MDPMDIISRYFWRLDTSLNMKRSTLVLGDTTAANFSMPRTSFLRSLSSVPEVADACPTCLMQQLAKRQKYTNTAANTGHSNAIFVNLNSFFI